MQVVEQLQELRSDLQLTVGDVADLCGLPMDVVWDLVDAGHGGLDPVTERHAAQLLSVLRSLVDDDGAGASRPSIILL